MREVKIQQHHIICASPNGYDGKPMQMQGGTGNQIDDENAVY